MRLLSGSPAEVDHVCDLGSSARLLRRSARLGPMPLRVQVRVVVEVDLEDAVAVSDAACQTFAAMDAVPPGRNPLPPDLERDLRQMPGLALEQLIDPWRLLEGIPGVEFVRAQTLVEPREAGGPYESVDMGKFQSELDLTRLRARRFVGLEEDEARQLAHELGFALRTWTSEDPDVTADWNPHRITAYVRGGKVINADAG